jgi:hypothetical protein
MVVAHLPNSARSTVVFEDGISRCNTSSRVASVSSIAQLRLHFGGMPGTNHKSAATRSFRMINQVSSNRCVLAAGDCKIGSLRRRSTKLPNVMSFIACWDNFTTAHLMRAVLQGRASIPLSPSRLNAPLAAWASGRRPAVEVRAPARPGRSSLAAVQSFLRSSRAVRALARMLHKQPASALHRE